MRIVSKQRDYYDCVQAQGQDRSIVYIRDPKEFNFGSSRFLYDSRYDSHVGIWPFPSLRGSFASNTDPIQYIIGFCGKIYPVLVLSDSPDIFCFSIADADAFVEKYFTDQEKEIYKGKLQWKHNAKILIRKNLVSYFEECNKKQEAFKKLFEDHSCPIFVASRSKWSDGKITYNGLLRPVQFMRVFDPYSAFQELAMYISNIAQPEKVMPVIDDEMKIQAHGFDKFSFRKPKKNN